MLKNIIQIMKEQEIKETLSDIKDLMERSQKVVFLDGAAGVVVGLWALLGAAVVSFWVYGSLSPLWGAWINPIRHADWASIFIVAGVCAVVFCAAFKTVWDMSKCRARREGLEFKFDAGSRHLLGKFFTVGNNHTRIGHLAAGFRVKRRRIKHRITVGHLICLFKLVVE